MIMGYFILSFLIPHTHDSCCCMSKRCIYHHQGSSKHAEGVHLKSGI